MTNKTFFHLVCMCLLTCFGCQDNKQREFNIKMIENDSQANGSTQGWKDGSNGFVYGYGYDDKLKGLPKASKQEREEYQELYSKGYKIGYDKSYSEAKKEYDSKHREIQTNGNKDIQSSPNSNPELQMNSGSIHSNEGIYGDYSNYEETDNCVEGVVVYEGDDDYYIVETRKGFTVLERYSGRLDEGDKVRGELNKYNFKYLINRNRSSEVKVYIEDYMLSDDSAVEWLGKNNHLKSDDQRIYNANNQ